MTRSAKLNHLYGALIAASLICLSGTDALDLPGLPCIGTAQAAPGDYEGATNIALQPQNLPMKGNPNGLVTIVEFSDYQCPFCSRVEPTIDDLIKEFPELRVVYAHMPLSFHTNALPAAKAAHAAFLQGKFWEMHQRLFANQKALNEDFYISAAESLGLDISKFKADMESDQTAAFIRKCSSDAGAYGLSGTPSFLINGESFVGAQPIDKFRTKINEALARAKTVKVEKKLTGEALYKELVNTAPKTGSKPSSSDEAIPDRVFIPDNQSPVLGDAKAPVTIVEFVDFQCPFCNRARHTVKELMKNNPGKIRLVFKHNPLPFHDKAELAHRAAEAAKKQGKFWQYYDLLYENQKALTRDDLIGYAKQLKLNEKKFIEYMDSPESLGVIKQDLEYGTKANIKGTPSFLFNGRRFVGAQSLQSFQNTLDEELGITDRYKKKKLTGSKLYEQIAKDNAKPEAADAKPEAVVPKVFPTGGPRTYIDDALAPTLGSAKAPVTIVAYEDLQDGESRSGFYMLEDLIKAHPDQIRLVFKHAPRSKTGDSMLVHRAAYAAQKLGKFWEYRDKIYNTQRTLSRDDLLQYANDLKLNEKKFTAIMDGPESLGTIHMNLDEATRNNVSSAPHYFINGSSLPGAPGLSAFEAIFAGEQKVLEVYASDKKLTGQKLYERIAKEQPAQKISISRVTLEGAPAFGPENAPVTIVVFSDFQCPFCVNTKEILDAIMKSRNDVRVVFKQFPLATHPDAQRAAEASLFAHAHGKFWELHDMMFENQKALSEEDILGYAEKIGLDRAELKKALDQGTYTEAVKNDIADGKKVDVTGTPSFLINDELHLGAMPRNRFIDLIDDALDKTKENDDDLW
ncbi:MAG: thioredoxin domain-containing protein [Proteobacteria bacterium]|nr:thioredoxin domain-containing protein [Pseudomonadota bacterium]